MADYGLEAWVYEMNKRAAEIAVGAARAFTAKTPDKPRFVIGCMGPTNRTASLSPDVDNPALRAISFDALMHAPPRSRPSRSRIISNRAWSDTLAEETRARDGPRA